MVRNPGDQIREPVHRPARHGNYSDKAIGTNHGLPTGRAARYTGRLWVGRFLKMVTTQRGTAEGSRLVAEHAAAAADAELMAGHAIGARLRLNPEFFPDQHPGVV